MSWRIRLAAAQKAVCRICPGEQRDRQKDENSKFERLFRKKRALGSEIPSRDQDDDLLVKRFQFGGSGGVAGSEDCPEEISTKICRRRISSLAVQKKREMRTRDQ
jgi:hypothetical protein